MRYCTVLCCTGSLHLYCTGECTVLSSNQWRVRESCCSGLTDLLRGRTLEDALDTLALLWQDVFRVMDDIKESVRVAATKTAQSLSRVSIKMCDSGAGSR